MNESKPLPLRCRPCLARFVHWTMVAMLAMGLGVVALGVGLHGLIVPRIGGWQSQVEAWASRVVGAPVRMAAIVARSEGIVPTIELHDVQLQDSAGQTALRVSKLVLGVSVRSLLRGGVEQLYLEGVQLQVQRSTEGMWHVAGRALPDSGTGDGAGLEWLLAQPEVAVRQAQVHLSDDSGSMGAWRFTNVDAVLRGGGRRQAWRVVATPVRLHEESGDQFQPVEFTGVSRSAWLSAAPTWQR